MIIYLAGPITDNDPNRRRNIDRAITEAARIRALGHVVVCPHEMGAARPEALDYEGWMSHGIALLRRCDAICLLPGWAQSAGTLREIDAAAELGIPRVTFLDTWSVQ